MLGNAACTEVIYNTVIEFEGVRTKRLHHSDVSQNLQCYFKIDRLKNYDVILLAEQVFTEKCLVQIYKL